MPIRGHRTASAGGGLLDLGQCAESAAQDRFQGLARSEHWRPGGWCRS